jgi:hypothetical protein
MYVCFVKRSIMMDCRGERQHGTPQKNRATAYSIITVDRTDAVNMTNLFFSYLSYA